MREVLDLSVELPGTDAVHGLLQICATGRGDISPGKIASQGCSGGCWRRTIDRVYTNDLLAQQTLVLRQRHGAKVTKKYDRATTPFGRSWSFHIIPIGVDRCRLVTRSRAARQHGLAAVATRAMDPVTLVMERKMLLSIKARTERFREAVSTA